jgi:hypothetical protein
MNILEMKKIGKILDTAAFSDIFYNSTQEQIQKKSEKHLAIINKRTDKLVTVVSDHYHLVQHSEMIDAVGDAISRLNLNAVAKVIDGGNKVFVDINFPDVRLIVSEGEEFIGGIRLVNSFDKSTGIMVLPQIQRLVCKNGMVLSRNWIKVLNVRHTSKLAKDFEVIIPQIIADMVNGCDKLRAMINNCISESISFDSILKLMKKQFPAEKHRERIISNLKDLNKAEINRWEYYNSITKYISHSKLKPSVEMLLHRKAERIMVTPFARIGDD